MMQVMTYATAGYFGGSADFYATNSVLSGANGSLLSGANGLMNPELERFFLLVSMLVATVVVFYSGKPFFDNALTDLGNRHLGMDVPVALAIAGAYLPSVYVVLSHANAHVYFDSAVMFVFFLSLGRFIEMRARHTLSGSGLEVQDLLPEQIAVQRRQASQMITQSIKPTDVLLGDQSQLKAGTIVPFDAKITAGIGQFDESLVTGEAYAIKRAVGDLILAGSKLLGGVVIVESTGNWSASSIAKVQASIKSAERSTQDEQRRSRLISRYFILAVLLLTAVVGSVWFVLAPARVFDVCLAMLIASCPCAFALAAPIGRSAAIHSLRRVGVLLTSNAALDSIAAVTRWCFDKTGTLTRGRPSIETVTLLSSVSQDKCLQIIACIESRSEHVLSSAFSDIQTELRATDFNENIGQGVTALVDGELYLVGKLSWILALLPDALALSELKNDSSGAEVVLANASDVLAIIQLQDELRPSARALLSMLNAGDLNIHNHSSRPTGVNVTLLSGDHQSSVEALSDQLGISDYTAGLLPADKLERIRRYQAQGEVVAMVGDGINDAPVLAAADVSIAIASGSELALNNADVVLLNGNLENLASLVVVARKAATITRQNLAWALAYNAIALPLAASGFLTPWIAALGMSVSSVFVVLNALRIRNTTLANAAGNEKWR